MDELETVRLVLRAFADDDWSDVQVLAVDWKSAPGPEFDKWPTTEKACKGLTDHFANAPGKYYAMYLRDGDRVVGLLALNGIEEDGQMDLGHIIFSKYQDDDVDREALEAIVGHIFMNEDVSSIVTRNADDARQLAPLLSLGFTNRSKTNKGELVLAREERERPEGS